MTLRLQFITYFVVQIIQMKKGGNFGQPSMLGENRHDKNDSQISELLLLGVSSNNHASNTCILNATIQYMLCNKRFDASLTNSRVV